MFVPDARWVYYNIAPGTSADIIRGDIVAIMTLKGELVATGVAQKPADIILAAKSGIVVDINRVIMAPSVYPKYWQKS